MVGICTHKQTPIWCILFLAAMSSSRSNVITQFVFSFVFSFVFPLFFLLVSFEFYLVLKSFNGVLGVFEVSRVFQGSFKEAARKF